MKRNAHKKVLTVFVLLLSLLVLSSCGEDGGGKPYDCLVTFDYNTAGTGESAPEMQYLGVKKNGRIGLKPGQNDDFKEAVIPHYFIEGWYTAKTAEDGSVLRDGSGSVILAKEWDFASDTVTTDITLYAKLTRQGTFVFTDIETGEVLKTQRGKPGEIESDPLPPTKKGYTLLGYYLDREKTQPFAFDKTTAYPDGDLTVYADFIEGEYTLAGDAATLLKCIRGGKNAYLTCDIDASGITWASVSYNGKIVGNGHKVTGLKIAGVCSKRDGETYGLLFKNLGAKAKISDITFEDVTMTVSVGTNGTYGVAPIAYGVNEGARLEKVVVTGTLTYDFGEASTSTVYADFGKEGAPAGTLTDCRFAITLVDRNG